MATYLFRLFVAGDSARAARAIRNLDALCRDRLGGDAEFEVVDIVQDPEAAETHRVLSTPTLDRTRPEPRRRAIGDFSDTETLVRALGLFVHATSSETSAP